MPFDASRDPLHLFRRPHAAAIFDRSMLIKSLKSIARQLVPTTTLERRRVRLALAGSDEPELQLFPVLSRGGAFLDVGANIGFWTGPASRTFGSVHAFEPDPGLADALRRNVASNVTVHELALSDHEGEGRFMVPVFENKEISTRSSLEANANPGLALIERRVRLARLDSLGLTGVDAIKIDVEGHEAAVIAGAAATIARERPTLIVEIEERHHPKQSEPIIAGLVARNYACGYLRGQAFERYESGRIDDLQPQDKLPELGHGKPGDYINNFLFVPNERVGLWQALEVHIGQLR